MARKSRMETKTETVTSTYMHMDVTCDGCGREIDIEKCEVHKLMVVLDGDLCVNFQRYRDYCDDCLTPIWKGISKLIKADPDAERDREYDPDDYYY